MSGRLLQRRMPAARAAQLLGVSVRHVRSLIADGELEGLDVRRPRSKRARWAVSVASVEAFLCSRSQKQGLEGLEVSAWARVNQPREGN